MLSGMRSRPRPLTALVLVLTFVVAVAPGSKVSFDLTITSTRDANVGLALGGVPDGWTATLHGGGFAIDGVSAGPNTDATARLDINVPAEASGSQTITVTASGGGAQDVLPISVRVDAAATGDITITTDTPSLTGASNDTFPFALTVNNDTAQDVTVQELESRLRNIFETRKDKTMFIAGAGALRYGDIVEVIDAAKGAGVEKVGIVTEAMRRAAGATGSN